MSRATVTTFFYGSYINRRVLLELNVAPARTAVARLPGYDIVIRPLANLVASDQHTVYGVLAGVTHAELERIYAHARETLGGVYHPYPVLAFTRAGHAVPALCYIAGALAPARPQRAYVERILVPARELGFPGWYLRRLESFLSGGRET